MIRSKEKHEELMKRSREREAKRKAKKKKEVGVISLNQHLKIVATYKAEIKELKRELKQIKQLKYIECTKSFIGEDRHSITVSYRI